MDALNHSKKRIDWVLLGLMFVLIAIGLMNLYSATRSAPHRDLFTNQLMSYAIGFAAFCFVAWIDFRFWQKWSWFLYAILVLLLIFVLLKGRAVNGSRRWLDIGFFPLQPSELVKIGVILLCAQLFSKDPFDLEFRPLTYVLAWYAVWLLPVGLIMRQPDLGTALICILVAVTMFVLIRIRPTAKVIVLGINLVSAILIFVYGLKEYQRKRLLNPENDPTNHGWQPIQAKIAIGSGRIWGKGYLQGTQKQFRFLPEHWTDFPFAVLAEEWGLVGCLVLLFFYFLLLLWMLKIANETKDRFGRNVVLGCVSLLFWHIFVNVAMVTNLAPVVGVTLPMISYGGSSLLTTLIALGLCMNVSMRRMVHEVK